jgi:Deacetylase PdaC
MRRAIFLAGPLLLLATLAEARPVKIVHNSAILEFAYEWPAGANTVPELVRRFRAEAQKDYLGALDNARMDHNLAREEKRDFNPEFYSRQWTTAGQTPRLLSLQFELGAFTGGAHPNTVYGALLWDRRAKREINMSALFLRPRAFLALTQTPYCAALNAERLKRRNGEKLTGSFVACPKFAELAIAPVDKNRDGRFETIEYVAAPYTAGPYVEGPYDISLPITSQLISAIKPEYRSAFARQRQ